MMFFLVGNVFIHSVSELDRDGERTVTALPVEVGISMGIQCFKKDGRVSLYFFDNDREGNCG